MTKRNRIYYQPEPAHLITIWSWIGFILALALIVQLEITTVNWFSIGILIVALALIGWNLLAHQLTVQKETITLRQPLNRRSRLVQRADVSELTPTKYGLLIATTELDYKPTQLLMTPKNQQRLCQELMALDWPVKQP